MVCALKGWLPIAEAWQGTLEAQWLWDHCCDALNYTPNLATFSSPAMGGSRDPICGIGTLYALGTLYAV